MSEESNDTQLPTVGVVIPAYNAAVFIDEALEGVAAQTHQPDRVVVVDDGSVDGTGELLRRWEELGTLPLKVIRQENRGLSLARNRGIIHSPTDLIALLDADDVWEPFHLERILEGFRFRPDIVLLFANHRRFSESRITNPDFLSDKPIHRLSFHEEAHGLRVLENGLFQSLIGGNYIPPSTSVFRKVAAEKIGLFNPALRMCEDRDFVLRLSRVGRFGYFPDSHAWSRVHDNNLTHPKNALSLQEYGLRVILNSLRDSEQLELSPEEEKAARLAARRQARGILGGRSRLGFRTYLTAVDRLCRHGLVAPVCNPIHLLRAAYRTLRPAP